MKTCGNVLLLNVMCHPPLHQIELLRALSKRKELERDQAFLKSRRNAAATSQEGLGSLEPQQKVPNACSYHSSSARAETEPFLSPYFRPQAARKTAGSSQKRSKLSETCSCQKLIFPRTINVFSPSARPQQSVNQSTFEQKKGF